MGINPFKIVKYCKAKEYSGLHYLLATPFRYPPLLYGSRFGTRAEPSLWYGSLKQQTAMAETAYYRFIFIRASQAKLGIIEMWVTAFLTKIKTKQGIDLTQPPFSNYRKNISSPITYEESQSLGTPCVRPA